MFLYYIFSSLWPLLYSIYDISSAEWTILQMFFFCFPWEYCCCSSDIASISAKCIVEVTVAGMKAHIPFSPYIISLSNPWFNHSCLRPLGQVYQDKKNSFLQLSSLKFTKSQSIVRQSTPFCKSVISSFFPDRSIRSFGQKYLKQLLFIYLTFSFSIIKLWKLFLQMINTFFAHFPLIPLWIVPTFLHLLVYHLLPRKIL